ncbi:MAG: hypothetical protein JRE23_16290 [Deltaproteobacteria bacterium]|nr:hypothetical protein [Deltaproteobacteria bacterium]
MIYLIGALILASVVIFFQIKSGRKKNNEISGLKDEVYNLAETIEDRNETINNLEEINLETAKKKKKIRTGSNTDKFNNSLNELSDVPADSGTGKD